MWDNSETTTELLALSAGDYAVTVKDAIGCEIKPNVYDQ